MMTLAHFAWPDTVGGWAALTLATVLIAATVGGIIVRLLQEHVSGTVFTEVEKRVLPAVELCLRETNVKLDGLRVNQAEMSAELGRVRILEAKIDNGLTHKMKDVSDKVDRIKQRQIVLIGQVSEMHGWMQSRNQYDGVERRVS